MFNTLQEQHFNDGKTVNLRLEVSFLDGTSATLTGDDVARFNIDWNIATSNSFSIGNAESSQLSLSLIVNDAIRYKSFGGAKIVVYYVFPSSEAQAGIFWVDEEPRIQDTIDLICFDKMARLRRKLPKYTYPIKASTLLLSVLTECGIELGTMGEVNTGYLIEYSGAFDSSSCQQMVGWIAGLMGGNAIVDELGTLHIVSRSSTLRATFLPQYTLTLSDTPKPTAITGVQYETEDTIYINGDDTDLVIDISNNPLVSGGESEVLQGIASIWQQFEFYPFENLEYEALPYLRPSDVIELPDGKVSLITNLNYSLNGTMRISCAGTEPTVKGLATGALSDSEIAIIKSVAKRTAEILSIETTGTYEQALLRLNEELTNALGYYTTTKEVDGKTITYRHDSPTLEESNYIEYKPEAGSLAWTDGGWNNGNPIWQYGFTKQGSLLMRSIDTVTLRAEQILLSENKTIVQRFGELQTVDNETNTRIDDLGLTIDERTTIDGEPVSEKVAKLTADYLSLSSEVGNFKSGGTNIILNSNYGNTQEPSDMWWGTTKGIRWNHMAKRYGTWENVKVNTQTWATMKSYKDK